MASFRRRNQIQARTPKSTGYALYVASGPVWLEQRSYRLQEILESERLYVSDLEQVLTYITYMRESKETEDANIPMPEELKQGRDRMIFGNIESIYEWHRE